MKSHEISEVTKKDSRNIKHKDWQDEDHVMDYFYDKGFQHVGEGAYAVVMKKGGSNKIVKISKEEDQCWIKYVNWIKKQQNNPHVPKVFMLRHYTDSQGSKRFIAVIETLLPLPVGYDNTERLLRRSTDLEKIAETYWIENVGNYGMGIDSAVHYLERDIDAAREYGTVPVQGLDEFEAMSNEEIASEILFKYGKSKFVTTLHRIMRQIKTNKCFEDIHEGNIMIRPGSKELVITDPVGTGPGFASPWSN